MSSRVVIASGLPLVPIGQLATALKSILDLFNNFNIPSDGNVDFVRSLRTLDIARLRLLLWAHSNGLAAENPERRLHAPEIQKRLITTFGDLEGLLSSNAELVMAYGTTASSPGASSSRRLTMGDVSFRAFVREYQTNHPTEARAYQAAVQASPPATTYTIVRVASFHRLLKEVINCVHAIHAILPPPVPDARTVRYFRGDVVQIGCLSILHILLVGTRSFYLGQITIVLQARVCELARAQYAAWAASGPPVLPEREPLCWFECRVFGWESKRM